MSWESIPSQRIYDQGTTLQTTLGLLHYHRILYTLVHKQLTNSNFYPNVTTLRSGLCCCNSVCLSVCRLSVTLMHPAQGVEAFGNISSPLCTLAIL